MSQSLVKSPRLLPECSICGYYIRGDVLSLVKAFVQVEMLLPAFMLAAHLLNKLNLVGWVIRVRYPNIEDQIRALFVKPTAHNVSLESFLLGERCCIRRAEKNVLRHRILLS